jgi:hypothetical protein
MKYVKMLGLLAVAAAALMAFAGTASATSITSNEGTTPTINASAGKTELHPGSGTSFLTVSCNKSTVKGAVEQHGAGVTVKGKIAQPTDLTFTECSDPVTVLAGGSLEVHAISPTGNGTLTSSGAEVRVHTSEGPVCTFKTSGTHIGTLTGSDNTKGHAVLHIGAAGSAPIPASGFLCPSTGLWTGSYTITKPSSLSIH